MVSPDHCRLPRCVCKCVCIKHPPEEPQTELPPAPAPAPAPVPPQLPPRAGAATKTGRLEEIFNSRKQSQESVASHGSSLAGEALHNILYIVF